MDLKSKLIFLDMVRPESGCKSAETYTVFKAIFDLTNGNPCSECGYKDDCYFLKRLEEKEKRQKIANFGRVDFETNAQIAKRLSKKMGRGIITSRQVSKMRKRGELKDW